MTHGYCAPLVIATLCYSGLRRAELLAANVNDLREEVFDEHVHRVLTVTGKGGRLREVPVHASMVNLLARHLRAGRMPADPGDAAAGTPLLDDVDQPPASAERAPTPSSPRSPPRTEGPKSSLE